ncbi:MAG TPA: hypothetical protein VK534_00765 [Methylomirabilota bacterium]|nr:hypothetical protein [Methylomirabilota bacterium]
MSSTIKASDGFTAVELLVMLVVLMVTFIAFSSSFTTIHTINKQAQDINTANSIAFAKAQSYENKPFVNLPATTPLGTLVQVEDFTSSLPASLQEPHSALVYVNSVSTTLKQIVVDIRYGTAPQHTIQYADFIQKNGL